jgi:hypothetical protein
MVKLFAFVALIENFLLTLHFFITLRKNLKNMVSKTDKDFDLSLVNPYRLALYPLSSGSRVLKPLPFPVDFVRPRIIQWKDTKNNFDTAFIEATPAGYENYHFRVKSVVEQDFQKVWSNDATGPDYHKYEVRLLLEKSLIIKMRNYNLSTRPYFPGGCYRFKLVC